ncbi:MAG: hypothetical protein ABSF03_05740 [Streptosporangiaceae bacterium]
MGVAFACGGLAPGVASAQAAASAAPSVTLTAAQARLPSPEVGMQDGWISRGGPLGTSIHGQGCDSNEENNDATPVPPPVFQATIPTAVDDGAHWTNLKVRYERITVPWDVAYHHDHPVTVVGQTFDPNQVLDVEQACLNYWLADIDAFNQTHPGLLVQPEVQFRPDYNHLGTGSASGLVTAPSYQEYKAALDAFTSLYSCGASTSPEATCPTPADPTATPYPAGTSPRIPRVATLTPWGEPDFDVRGGARPNGVKAGGYVYMANGKSRLGQDICEHGLTVTNCGPVLAAQMWVLAYHRCRNCTVIAGTFGSSEGKDRGYLAIYVDHLDGIRPRVWAIDDYTDVWLQYEQLCLSKKGRKASSCPVPSPQITLLNAYSSWLDGYHYTAANTRIWLGEISVFDINSFGSHQHFGPTIEHHAADYLLKDLAKPGAFTAPGAPEVQRLYYMRYEDGTGYPDFALVLDHDGQEAPVPAYAAFRYRTNPR